MIVVVVVVVVVGKVVHVVIVLLLSESGRVSRNYFTPSPSMRAYTYAPQ